MAPPKTVLRLAPPFLCLVAGGCVFVTTPCGTRIGFATGVEQVTFECTSAAGDHLQAGLAASHADAAVIGAIKDAFLAGAKAAVVVP